MQSRTVATAGNSIVPYCTSSIPTSSCNLECTEASTWLIVSVGRPNAVILTNHFSILGDRKIKLQVQVQKNFLTPPPPFEGVVVGEASVAGTVEVKP